MKEDKIDIFLQTLLKLTGLAGIIYIIMFISSCNDKIYIGGYNKDFEEISALAFEVDSLIMTIQIELDSLDVR
tara:strand:- start:1257 stop:1475 length:219 start_codon:yes stop_codon:yes gene_type:complete